MPTSNLKLFDENKANMLSDEEYNTNTQRLNGVQTGVASSSLQNKTLYQTSLVAYAIGQLMIANGKDATDSAAVSNFVANMDATMLQKVKDIATTEEAQQGLLNTKYMTPALTKVAIEYMLAHDITLGGSLTLHSDPTTELQAATKNYVDTTIASKVVKETLLQDIDLSTVKETYGVTYIFGDVNITNLGYQIAKIVLENVTLNIRYDNVSSSSRLYLNFINITERRIITSGSSISFTYNKAFLLIPALYYDNIHAKSKEEYYFQSGFSYNTNLFDAILIDKLGRVAYSGNNLNVYGLTMMGKVKLYGVKLN